MTLFGDEHIERYRATDGREGHDWQGTSTLLLTTKGRRSGEPRTSPLIYGRHGDDYLVVASKGGAPEAPDWFLNLEAEPSVTVQIKGDKFEAKARAASPSEKPAMWQHMVDAWPAYSDYQKKTDRNIPVVVLERA
jgi:deazaflavin-dependent oxidoreductase (nitroreductase family)